MTPDDIRELRDDIKGMSENVTRITTTLDLNFHPETGTFTRQMAKLEAKVDKHETFVNRATWTGRIAAVMLGAGGLAWIKAKIGIGN